MTDVEDRSEEAVGLLLELPDVKGSTVLRAMSLIEGMELLSRAGYAVLLLPTGTTVRLGQSSTSRWWRRGRSK